MSRLRPAVLLALVAVATVLSGCSAGTAFTVGPSRVAAPSPSETLIPDPTVVMIGDSIMKGHGLAARDAWPALMGAQNDWRLDNLACDGAGFLTVGSDSDCGETFAGLVAKAVALHPRTVIIEGSSNDFGESNSALLPETQAQLAELRAALPHAQIIGLSTVWGDTAVPAQLADVDAQVRDAVTRVGGQFLNIGQPLSGHPEWMQSDDVHPTVAGQRALAAAVQAAFDAAHVHA